MSIVFEWLRSFTTAWTFMLSIHVIMLMESYVISDAFFHNIHSIISVLFSVLQVTVIVIAQCVKLMYVDTDTYIIIDILDNMASALHVLVDWLVYAFVPNIFQHNTFVCDLFLQLAYHITQIMQGMISAIYTLMELLNTGEVVPSSDILDIFLKYGSLVFLLLLLICILYTVHIVAYVYVIYKIYTVFRTYLIAQLVFYVLLSMAYIYSGMP